MVKVIEQGNLPDTTYRFRCHNCRTVYDAEDHECRESYEAGRPTVLLCRCPTCGFENAVVRR